MQRSLVWKSCRSSSYWGYHPGAHSYWEAPCYSWNAWHHHDLKGKSKGKGKCRLEYILDRLPQIFGIMVGTGSRFYSAGVFWGPQELKLEPCFRVGVLFGYFLWFFLVFFMVFRSADARVSQLVDSRQSGQSVGEPTERSVSQSVGQPTERPVSQSVSQSVSGQR